MSAPSYEIDTEAFIAALQRERVEQDMSWRDVARATGLSPALLTRLHQGSDPRSSTFLTLCAWLGMSADTFARQVNSVQVNEVDELPTIDRTDDSVELIDTPHEAFVS